MTLVSWNDRLRSEDEALRAASVEAADGSAVVVSVVIVSLDPVLSIDTLAVTSDGKVDESLMVMVTFVMDESEVELSSGVEVNEGVEDIDELHPCGIIFIHSQVCFHPYELCQLPF